MIYYISIIILFLHKLKVISGEKPECFELVKDKQIKTVIENCINVDPNERSSAKDLLLTDFFVSHSFQLESKLSDTNDQILKFELIQAPDPNKNLKGIFLDFINIGANRKYPNS